MPAPLRFEYTLTPVEEPSSEQDDPWKGRNVVDVETGGERGSNVSNGPSGSSSSSSSSSSSFPSKSKVDGEKSGNDSKSRIWPWGTKSGRSRSWTWWSDLDQDPKPTTMHADWKPLSMTTPILLAVTVASLLMVAAIELLAQRSGRQGGLALSPSLDDIPSYATISAQYVPQLLAVLYSLVWSWIDLDVKRMQPWYELAKPAGASAADSLFLDYPFTFVASVPFIAGRRRYVSAQLGTGSVNHSSYLELVNRSELVPVAQQEDLLGPEVLNLMYPISWLNQSYPEFMLPDKAFLPFYPEESSNLTAIQGTNLTAATTQLWTELDCWPAADISVHGGNGSIGNSTFDIDSGRGCKTNMAIPIAEGYSMLYVGYYSSPYSDFYLGTTDCPETPDHKHQFLAIWAHATGDLEYWNSASNVDITGAFCQPRYFKQEVLVTVDASTLRPYRGSAKPLGAQETLADSEFNRTAFEFLLGNGMSETMKTRDYPFNFVVEQHPKLEGRDLIQPVSNMVGFALAGQELNTTDYADQETLQRAYNDAHQHLFSVAVNQLLVNGTELGNSTATATRPMSGIIVSRAISAALEALLVVVAIATALILWLARSTRSNLHANPSSIDRIADIVRESPELADFFCSISHADEDSIVKATEGKKFRLIRDNPATAPRIIVDSSVDPAEKQDSEASDGYYVPVRPLFLRIEIGVAFVIAVLGVIGGLGYLKWAEVHFHGLQRPSTNQEVQQILENYIPTVLSTMIEPFWILINRLLCVLQPFNQLWQGKARPKQSVSATYTSIPPQFALWRSLKSGHVFLSTVCSAVFLANVLTISLPAVFTERVVTARYSETFHPTVSAQFNNNSVHELPTYLLNSLITTSQYSDHAYSLLSNISQNTPLLPWTSHDYFFQPFEITQTRKNMTVDFYSIRTRGFGIRTNCTPVAPQERSFEQAAEPVASPNASFCGDDLKIATGKMYDETYRSSSGVSAVEYLDVTTGGKVPSCDRTVTFGWARAQKAEDLNATIRTSFAICVPIFETALFDVDVDPAGYVQGYTRAGKLESTLDYPNSDDHIDAMVASSNGIIGSGVTRWHNDTLTRDWISHLVMVKTGSRADLDPQLDVPNPEDVIPNIDPIFRTLFALLLALNRDYLFTSAGKDEAIGGERLVVQTRLFMDQAALTTSFVLLAVNVVIAVFLYSRKAPFVLPRMPTTLGSIITYIAPSRLFLEEKSGRALDSTARTFSFGRFIGRDGAAHVGIEVDPHVVPIDPASFGKPAGKRWGIFGKRSEETPFHSGPWL
ncbi:Protein of unknown function (DUF3433) [Geosmithia morbida]|uniref:Uncharacterized protein n=1 Tax=Geosmithia morbida TaxID=1094350 RepID=A0A9P5CZI7_9HYPO|nr:Protein of unknown function (DUF3433) [Geosmithia morbida]KAF4120542.1 Protein of unknown function (DUF3433) [Geosmithia morbida]